MEPQRGLVTPEAVLLDLEVAGPASRVLARALDLLVVLLGTWLLLIVVALFTAASGGTFPQWVGFVFVAVLGFVVIFGYPAALESVWRGRTVGKAALGIRVVTATGGPVTFRHAATRAALGVIDLFLSSGFLGVTSMLLSPRRQRLGDLVAGTIVLRERSATGRLGADAVQYRVPPELDAVVAELDPTLLTPPERRVVRSTLLRLRSMNAQGRLAVSAAVADMVEARIGQSRPEGMRHDLYLSAVAVALQRRTRTVADLPPPPDPALRVDGAPPPAAPASTPPGESDPPVVDTGFAAIG